MDNTKPIRVIALVGVVMKILQTVMTVGVYLFPQPALRLFGSGTGLENADAVRHPFNLMMPVLSLGIYLVLYFLLMSHLKQKEGNAAALGIATGAYFLIVSPLLSLLANFLRNIMIGSFYGTKELAATGLLSAALSFVNIMTSAATPALMIAAALIWYRERYCPQNPA